jgi:ABC-2 type transport system permease protein
MREIAALFRAAWLTEASYRLNMAFSLASLLFMVVPLYFVATALQPVMATTIASQSRQYFAFALLGATIYTFVAACTSALPTALASAIGRGTLEAFLSTPARLSVLFAGMSAYSVAWAFIRGTVMVAAGVALGARLHWSGIPALAVILFLLVIAHGAVGLFACALLLRFRTTGPLLNGMLTASALLGGVYYPTHVIPSWLQQLSRALPLSYGLRAARQASLLGEPLGALGHDVGVLALYAIVCFPLGVLSVTIALRSARQRGTLGQY